MSNEYEELLEEYRIKNIFSNETFIKDGIVELEKYNTAKKKILFINKEPYSEEEQIDLREFAKNVFAKYSSNQIWDRIAQIAYCILNSTNFSFPSYAEADMNKKLAIREIAVINLKKFLDKNEDNNKNLTDCCERDFNLIKSQIEIINPDIIVLGGVYNLIEDKIINSHDYVDQDKCFIIKSNNRLVFNYCHPSQYNISNHMYYYTFAGAYFKYLQTLKEHKKPLEKGILS